jgi:hypothetical protein
MVKLKLLKPDAIPAAIVKARQYRLLNEPNEAESICLDILEIDPDHQDALITLLLSLTDKFTENGLFPSFEQAQAIVGRLNDSHCKSYFGGIIFERRGKYHLQQAGPGSGSVAYDWLHKAMEAFGEALVSCDPENQDTILRWNSCARIINSNPDIKPVDGDNAEMLLDAY